MRIFQFAVVFIISVAICKGISLIAIMLFALIKKEAVNSFFLKENERKLIFDLEILYIVSDFISSLAAYGMLNYLSFDRAFSLSVIIFILKALLTYIRYRKKGGKYFFDKFFNNKKASS